MKGPPMNDALFDLLEQKYMQLNTLLNDFTRACEMEQSEDRAELIASIKHRTNHMGVHYSALELATIFLGKAPLRG